MKYETIERELSIKRLMLQNQVASVENAIDDIHIKYLKESMPENIKKVELYLKTKIKRLVCFTYTDEWGEWAEMILINKRENLTRIELETSGDWQHDEPAIQGKKIEKENNGIFKILRKIWDEYPYSLKEYV